MRIMVRCHLHLAAPDLDCDECRTALEVARGRPLALTAPPLPAEPVHRRGHARKGSKRWTR